MVRFLLEFLWILYYSNGGDRRGSRDGIGAEDRGLYREIGGFDMMLWVKMGIF